MKTRPFEPHADSDHVLLIWVVMATICLVGLLILSGPLVMQSVNAERDTHLPNPEIPAKGKQQAPAKNISLAMTSPDQAYTVATTVIYPGDAPRFARLRRWVQENGGQINGTEIRSWPGTYERGVFALRDLVPGDRLVIPKKICLSTLHGMATPVIGPFVKALRGSLGFDTLTNDRVALALFIAFEKLVKGPTSFWFPYLDTLAPSSTNFTHLLFAPEELFDRYGIREMAGNMFAMHRAALAELLRAARLMSHHFPEDEDLLERELRWAYYMVLSRAWSRTAPDGTEYLELTPYGDIINHKIHGDLVTASSDTDNLFLVMPGKEVRAGAELFDSYHHRPTALMYAQLWGFVPGPEEIYVVVERLLEDRMSVDQRRLLSFLGCLRSPLAFGTEFSCGEQDFFEDRAALRCWRVYRMEAKKATPALAHFLGERLLHKGRASLPDDDLEDLASLRDLMHLITDALLKHPANPNDEVLQHDPALSAVERLMVRMRLMNRVCFVNVLKNVESSALKFVNTNPALIAELQRA